MTNQPSQRPFLVLDAEAGKINRYCTDHDEAENQARRLNKVFYPETVTEDADGAPAEPRYHENLSLF
jgi:hypothetical protein